MIFFFDKLSENTKKLQRAIKRLKMDARTVVLEENGFLPEGISSPYEYYISQKDQEEQIERRKFYEFLKVPEYWEIRSYGSTGGIYYMGRQRAVIHFIGPVEKQIVQRVEWRMENGWIYRVDFYNKYGSRYASEFRDPEGNVESKVFYSGKNQEVIVEQPGNDVVTLVENGTTKALFRSRADFIAYYMKELAQNEKCVLFVQDEKKLASFPPNTDEQIWDYVCFSNHELLNQYVNMGGQNGFRFYALPEQYPYNDVKSEALILTMSDQIEKIEEITQALPDVNFHIAANTLVSDKLEALGRQENVNIYPCVSQETLENLWEKCSFYLDINHWREIHDAVNMAHEKNLLVMGFENTLHHRELLLKGCIFSEGDYEKMVYVIDYIIKNPMLMQKLQLVQQKKRVDVWKEFIKSAEETVET